MSSHLSQTQSPAMVLAASSRKFTLDHPFALSARSQAGRFDGESVDQHVDLFNTSNSALPSPALLSFRYISQTSYSPPLTPPGLILGTLHEQNDRSFPSMPSTPLLSPIPAHDEGNSPSWPCTMNEELSCNRITLDPYAQPFVPARPQFTQKNPHWYTATRRVPQPLLLMPPRNRPRPSHRAKSDRVLTSTANHYNAHLYSAHFPAGHVLHRDFVRKYAPGGQIGVGAFGFVVTGRDRFLGHEVAVKFIEKGKVPSWGWGYDPELGNVPTEAILLKLLNHPGIIRFLDFFQDKVYCYLVQELHGSPWRGKQQLYGAARPLPTPRLPGAPDEPASASPTESGGEEDAYLGFTTPSDTSPSSSSTLSSPPCFSDSSLSPDSVSTSSPLTPPHGARPNMGRRLSHDLFECIEEYQRLSESQARYIFAQVVDVVDYLDSIGITHRDIKDENVLIDRSFRVKLIDFGAASCVDPRRPRPWYRHFRGTIAYAPAEIIKGMERHQAEPADIWALGILLSYLITGKSAFPTAIDAAHGRITLHSCTVRVESKAQAPSPQGHSISPECWDLLTRCLHPDPHTRATVAEIKVHPWLHRALDEV